MLPADAGDRCLPACHVQSCRPGTSLGHGEEVSAQTTASACLFSASLSGHLEEFTRGSG